MSGIIATRLAQKRPVCNSKMKVWWRCEGKTLSPLPRHSDDGPMPATTHSKLTMPVRLSRHPRLRRAGPTHGDGKFPHSLRRPTERRVLDMIERGSWAGLLPSGT
jgi:hypothetical protein